MASFAGASAAGNRQGATPPARHQASSCTAIIVHPTHEHGLLSSIVPTLATHREVVLTFLPGGPRICNIHQGRHVENVGQLLWRSGVALASWIGKRLSENPDLFAGKSILELGCGCAPLASIVAAEWGATKVVATDGDTEVIELAQENVEKNTMSKSIVCERLEWGDRKGMKRLMERHTRRRKFDVILAADVIYFAGAHKSLISTLIEMSSESTDIYLAFQKRLHDFEGTFFSELLPRAGFKFEVVWSGDGGGGWDNLAIVKMNRLKSGDSDQNKSEPKEKILFEQCQGQVSSKKVTNREKNKCKSKSKNKMKEKNESKRRRARSDDIEELVHTYAKNGEEALRRKLTYFKSDGRSVDLVKAIDKSIVWFHTTLSSRERSLVHYAASKYKIFHWSIGVADSRRVCISRVIAGKKQDYSSSATGTIAKMKPTIGPGGSTTYNALPKPQILFQRNKPSDLLQNEGLLVKQHPHISQVDSLINAAGHMAAKLRREIRDSRRTSSFAPSQKDPPAKWVDTVSALKNLSNAIQGAQSIAVDLEMHNVRSYYGFTCLLQLSLHDGSDYLVDTIALWDHIGEILGHHFANPEICKVFHSCEGGDIAALHRDFQIFCVNIFDTQHAARLLGLPLGLGMLLAEVIPSVNILDKDRSTTMSDWRVRPLSDKQLAYAALDTKHLLELRIRLVSRLSGIDLQPDAGIDDSIAMLEAASKFGASTASPRPLTQLEVELMNDKGFSTSDGEDLAGQETILSSDQDKVAFESSDRVVASSLSSAAPEFVPEFLAEPGKRSSIAKTSLNGLDIEADSLCHCLVLSQKSSLKLFKPRNSCRKRAAKKLKKMSRRRRKLSAAKRELFLDLFAWRDETARNEDESAEYVCPEGVFMSICHSAPVTLIELQKAWSPLPELLTGKKKKIIESLFETTRAWKEAHGMRVKRNNRILTCHRQPK